MRRLRFLALALLGLGCRVNASDANADAGATAGDETARARERMVEEQIEARGVRDPRVLAAMRKVPRHELVPAPQRGSAYEDYPLPIGQGQTISQPYVVAAMSEALALKGSERVLEVGTGSGYQAAVLAELAERVYTIEIVPELAARAKADLARLGYRNVEVREGDGWRGWPEAAPFDAIMVTAAPPEVPPELVAQLAVGGRLVIPVGRYEQSLLLLRRTEQGIEREELFGVRFVPMTGEAERRD
jgi:protein-L-isoaspartate(D-aspartate) O-methyltransferase